MPTVRKIAIKEAIDQAVETLAFGEQTLKVMGTPLASNPDALRYHRSLAVMIHQLEEIVEVLSGTLSPKEKEALRIRQVQMGIKRPRESDEDSDEVVDLT